MKTTAPLGVMAIAGRTGAPLPVSISAGAVSVALLFGMAPGSLLSCGVAAVTSPDSIVLTITVAAILVFNHLLEVTGRLSGLLPAVESWVSMRGLRLAFFPMLIGLLPMPGGAVFSAPMVDSVSRGMEMKGIDKAVVNYWFRHTCEYAWPLYPGIVLAGSLAGLPLPNLCLVFLPVTFLSFAIGMAALEFAGISIFATGRAEGGSKDAPADQISQRGTARPKTAGSPGATVAEIDGPGIVEGLGPILLILVLFPLLEGPVRSFLGAWGPRNSGLPAALLVGIASLCLGNRELLRRAAGFAVSGKVFSLALGVLSIMFFKETIEKCGAASQMAHGFGGSGAGVLVLAALIPFATGLVMGYSPGMVGASFPMLLKTFSAMGPHGSSRYVIVAFCSGFAGVLLSPAHLCLVLTKEYFGIKARDFYRRLLPMTLALAAGSWIYAMTAPIEGAFR